MKRLNIQIDVTGRRNLLDNNETIVLVFPQGQYDKYFIACVSFSPFGDNNLVEFSDAWVAYASAQDINHWDIAHMDASVKAAPGYVQAFTNLGFEGNRPAYAKQVFGILNNRDIGAGNNLCCGFGRQIKVNNNSTNYVVSLSSLPYNQTFNFEAGTKLRIFLAKGFQSNMIVPAAALTPVSTAAARSAMPPFIGSYLEIDLDDTNTVHFDSATNVFVEGGES